MQLPGKGLPLNRWVGAALVTVAAMAATDLPAADDIRTIDGLNNNLQHQRWGYAGMPLLRSASGSHYADGRSLPAGPKRPPARQISNAIFAQKASMPSAAGLSDYIWTWGQFLDHDLSLSVGVQGSLAIPVPAFDLDFDPFGTGTRIMAFRRSFSNPLTGITTPREQLNLVSSYIDGSMVYGSDHNRERWMRRRRDGELKVTATPGGDLLPFNDGTQLNANTPEQADYSTTLFIAGDIRANEQPTLAAIHTLFVREHNFQARRIHREHPELRDEQIYQQARRIVIGEIQHITYDEFLPALVGDALGADKGYDPHANAGISSVFSTAGFRLGHTLLSPQILRLEEDGKPIAAGPLSLRATFFEKTPPILVADGIEPILRGLAAQTAQELDDKVIDDVRNFLFGMPGGGGLDLITLNIQRGREMGLPDFNTLRTDYGLPRKATFAAMTSDPDKAATLERLYHGDVNDVDAFVGLLTEDRLPGRLVGETLMAVLVDQFHRSRAGDRLWYERALEPADLERVKSTRLSDILLRNTAIHKIQEDVFFVAGQAAGRATR